MAVQQNKKSPARRNNRRSHDFLIPPNVATDASTGEEHLRHHVSPKGFYKGKKVLADRI